MNQPASEWFHLRDAWFCASCEVVYSRVWHLNKCPCCGSVNTIAVSRWIKPLSETIHD